MIPELWASAERQNSQNRNCSPVYGRVCPQLRRHSPWISSTSSPVFTPPYFILCITFFCYYYYYYFRNKRFPRRRCFARSERKHALNAHPFQAQLIRAAYTSDKTANYQSINDSLFTPNWTAEFPTDRSARSASRTSEITCPLAETSLHTSH